MRVAVAVIFDETGRVLLTQRPQHADHGGQWEFPGGKLEPGEEAVDALIREVREEVGLEVLNAEFLTDVVHSYGPKQVLLHVYYVNRFKGLPRKLESQIDLCWANLNELDSFDFPAANQKIFQHLHRLR